MRPEDLDFTFAGLELDFFLAIGDSSLCFGGNGLLTQKSLTLTPDRISRKLSLF